MTVSPLSNDDGAARRAEAWVRKHLAEDFDMGELCRGIGVSPRTLARRLSAAVGIGPLAFVQRLRVETAVHLLQTSPLSLQEICRGSGSRPEQRKRLKMGRI